MYTVPKLEDYSPEALDRAVADLLAALDSESSALHSDADWKTFRDRWLARKNGDPDPDQRHLAEGRARSGASARLAGASTN